MKKEYVLKISNETEIDYLEYWMNHRNVYQIVNVTTKWEGPHTLRHFYTIYLITWKVRASDENTI